MGAVERCEEKGQARADRFLIVHLSLFLWGIFAASEIPDKNT
jgi:hypothetical protein